MKHMGHCKKVELRSIANFQLITRLTLDLGDLQLIATFLQCPNSKHDL